MSIPHLILITDLITPKHVLEKNLDVNILLRDKTAETRALLHWAKGFNPANLFIHDRLDITLAVNAKGIHLQENGVSPAIPKKLRPSLTVGVSVHHIEKGIIAQYEGADYVMFGPIFDTPSKRAFGPPQGLKKLEEICTKLTVPVIAVGGITPDNAGFCMTVGAHGIAAITAFQQIYDASSQFSLVLRGY